MKPKLLLFDIDGTLISTHGIPRIAMNRVLMRRYDNFVYDTEFNFSGRTDWEIVEHLLTYDSRSVDTERIHSILNEFAHELAVEIENGRKPLVYPGVEPLLAELNKLEHVHLGLVTGNILQGARIKLTAAGLFHYFPVGGFGDDARLRRALPDIAIRRAKRHYEVHLEKNNIWIIGDSIYDIDCAQANDLRCLAVSTGWTAREELQKMNPEYLVDTLKDYRRIINIFLDS